MVLNTCYKTYPQTKMGYEHDLSLPITHTRPWSIIELLRWKPILPSALQWVQKQLVCGQWCNEAPILQTTHSGTMMALLHRKAKGSCQMHCTSWLNTTLPASKYLKCFPSFISVEGHTDWITVTVLMYELQVSVTSCSGHNNLNEN